MAMSPCSHLSICASQGHIPECGIGSAELLHCVRLLVIYCHQIDTGQNKHPLFVGCVYYCIGQWWYLKPNWDAKLFLPKSGYLWSNIGIVLVHYTTSFYSLIWVHILTVRTQCTGKTHHAQYTHTQRLPLNKTLSQQIFQSF